MPDYIKQNVQWFPGHMAKTRRQIKEALSLVDGVIELVDARIPSSSRNPELDDIIKNKPRIILLNKSDIANQTATSIWLQHYKDKGYTALAVDCRSGRGLNKFPSAVKTALSTVIERNENKGMANKPLRLMVVGIPNTGKSSFINRMSKSAKAKVADTAGVTRQNQWFNVGNGIELLDTPGVLWPKFEDKLVGERLAFTGAVKDQIMDTEFLACRLLEFLKDNYNDLLEARYGITTGDIPPSDEETIGCVVGFEILERIGRKRGFLVSGGEINTQRAADTVLDEYRSGKIGRMTLEAPE